MALPGAKMENIEAMLELLNGMNEDELLDVARKGLARTLTYMRDDARANVPVGEGTEGVHLRDTIHYETQKTGDEVHGELIASSEHAVFVEMGTGPMGEHYMPSRAKDLSPEWMQGVTYSADGWFFPTGKTDENGKPEYRYTYGMEPRPFLYPAYKRYEKDVVENLRKYLLQHVRKRGGGE